MYGDVGKVGKKIPLTTLWLGVVKGILFVVTVRLGGICSFFAYMCGKVLSFLTYEDFLKRCLEVHERIAVELDFCGLSRAVKGSHPDPCGLAVDDGLRELYARLTVFGGDGESEVDDVGLYFTNSHV